MNCETKNASFSCVDDDADCPRRLFAENGIVTTLIRQRKMNGKPFGRPAYAVSFRLTGIEKQLSEWDIHRKTDPCGLLSQIPDHLRHYWWRGYFDGDGSLHIQPKYQSLAFWSTYDQDWGFVHELTDRLGFPRRKVIQYRRKGGRQCSSTWYTNRQDVICAVMEYIYQGDDVDVIGMKRKHNKYLDLLTKRQAILERRGAKRSKYQHVVRKVTRTGQVRWMARHWRHGHIGVFDTDDEAGAAMKAFMKTVPCTQAQYPSSFEYTSDR